MKKSLSLILAVMTVLAALTLAACSGNTVDPTSAPEKTETAVSTGEGAPTAAPTTETAAPTQSDVPTETPTPVPAKKSVNDAIGATSALTSCAAKITMLVTTGGDEPVDTKAEYEIAVDGVTAKGSRTVTAAGHSATVNVYSNGDGVYVKGAPDGAKASDYDLKAQIAAFTGKLPESAIADEKTTEADGRFTLKTALTDEEVKAAFAQLLLSFDKAAGNYGVGAAVSDAAVEIEYGDYVFSYKISFKLEIKGTDSSSFSTVEATVLFTNPGADLTVTAPDDLDSYTKL